jgi:hypothetical protein
MTDGRAWYALICEDGTEADWPGYRRMSGGSEARFENIPRPVIRWEMYDAEHGGKLLGYCYGNTAVGDNIVIPRAADLTVVPE